MVYYIFMENNSPTPKDEALSFCIDSEKSATWFLRKIRQLSEEKDAIKAATAQRLGELEADEARLTHLYGEQLLAWAQSESAARRRATITLPLAGMALAFRKTPARLEITDPSAAIAEATVRGLVKTSPDMSAYREAATAALEATGELMPGVEVRPEGTSFTWRAIKKGEEPQS